MFGAFASLSGDYDITLQPKEKTCTRIYGPYAKFPERWRRDNSKYLLSRLKGIPALLIHGKRDRVCPVKQTQLFARDMKRKGYDVTYIEDPKLGHNWKLWAGYLGAVFGFFGERFDVDPIFQTTG
jgi:dipeptidyl aminopeptidase/acylaminoacyl peptidase